MYLAEFKLHWRPLAAACIGMGLGSAFSHYTASLFGPPLLAEFGWSKADFALLGMFALVNLLFIPFAGRFTDRFGARTAAIVGFSTMPLGYLAFTLMTGHIAEFFAIWVVQHIFGILTTTVVFCRVVIERFDRARGLALSLVLTAPPTFAVLSVPLLGELIETRGWRAGYLALAAISVVGGGVAITMLGRSAPRSAAETAALRLSRRELGQLLRHPTLLTFLLAMFLVNLPQTFATTQLKLVLMHGGQTSAVATWMMSVYAGGVIVGRFLSGLALDRVPAHWVAIAVLGLPAVGYVLFASQISAFAVLFLAVGVIGFGPGRRERHRRLSAVAALRHQELQPPDQLHERDGGPGRRNRLAGDEHHSAQPRQLHALPAARGGRNRDRGGAVLAGRAREAQGRSGSAGFGIGRGILGSAAASGRVLR